MYKTIIALLLLLSSICLGEEDNKAAKVFNQLLQLDYSGITQEEMIYLRGSPYQISVKTEGTFNEYKKNSEFSQVVVIDDRELTIRSQSEEVWLYHHPKYATIKMAVGFSGKRVKHIQIFDCSGTASMAYTGKLQSIRDYLKREI